MQNGITTLPFVCHCYSHPIQIQPQRTSYMDGPMPRGEQLYYANPMMFTSNHSHPPPPPPPPPPLKFQPDLRDFAAHDVPAAHAALSPSLSHSKLQSPIDEIGQSECVVTRAKQHHGNAEQGYTHLGLVKTICDGLERAFLTQTSFVKLT